MELAALLSQIDELKDQIDGLRPIDPWQEKRIWQKLRLDWNYHSNAIEGNTLTFGETRLFLLHGLTAKGKPFKDYLDIKGHNEAISYLQEMVRQQVPLTEAVIRELHKILLVEPYEMDAVTPDGQPTKRLIVLGEYKSQPNHVRTKTGEMFFFAEPHETPAKMGDLMAWYRSELEKKELHPLLIASTFHYRFVRIHPFDDGNGRMARLLMNLILMQTGYVPIVIGLDIKESEYFPALVEADTTNNLSLLHQLISRELIHSLRLYLRAARGEYLNDLDDDLDDHLQVLKEQIHFATQKKRNEVQVRHENLNSLFKDEVQPFLTEFEKMAHKFADLFHHVDAETIIGETKTQALSDKETIQQINSRLQGAIYQALPVDLQAVFGYRGVDLDSSFRITLLLEISLEMPDTFSVECTIASTGGSDISSCLKIKPKKSKDQESKQFIIDVADNMLEILQMRTVKGLK